MDRIAYDRLDKLKKKFGDAHTFAIVITDAYKYLQLLEKYRLHRDEIEQDPDYLRIANEELFRILNTPWSKYEDVITALKQYETEGIATKYICQIRQDLEKGMSNLEKITQRKVA